MVIIYHNARCSKSRECLLELENKGKEVTIINYLENPPDKSGLKTLINKLGIKPIELVRQKEEIWIQKFKGKKLTDGKIIDALAKYPQLMERPIVVNGDNAVIARPSERAFEIL